MPSKPGFADWFKNVKTAGGGCKICKEDRLVCLDYHHLDEVNKVDTVSNMFRKYGKGRILKEIDKCILLCANCHRDVHDRYGKLSNHPLFDYQHSQMRFTF